MEFPAELLSPTFLDALIRESKEDFVIKRRIVEAQAAENPVRAFFEPAYGYGGAGGGGYGYGGGGFKVRNWGGRGVLCVGFCASVHFGWPRYLYLTLPWSGPIPSSTGRNRSRRSSTRWGSRRRKRSTAWRWRASASSRASPTSSLDGAREKGRGLCVRVCVYAYERCLSPVMCGERVQVFSSITDPTRHHHHNEGTCAGTGAPTSFCGASRCT